VMSAGAMRIRPYGDGDGPAVRALFIRINREVAPTAMRAEFEAYIARSLHDEIDRIPAYYRERDGGFWIAERAGALLAMYGLERADRRSAELRRMYVAPEARRRGIARTLLGHAEQVCRDRGFRQLVLSTSELQEPALALYLASGFRLLRECVGSTMTHKMVGGGLRRFHLAKILVDGE
jgi:GNAT superfamily N-acetyltransferase